MAKVMNAAGKWLDVVHQVGGYTGYRQVKGVAKPMDPPVPCDHDFLDITTLGDSVRKYRCLHCDAKQEQSMAAPFTPKPVSVCSTGDIGLFSPMYATTAPYDPMESYEELAAKLATLEEQYAETLAQKKLPVAPVVPAGDPHHREVDV